MAGSVKANRFNVSKIVYTIITKDDATGCEHGPIKELGKPMQVQLTPTVATGELYGGGVKQEDMTKTTGYNLKVDLNKIPIENRAEIGGHTYANGVITEKPTDQAPNIAVGYEVEETGNHKELVWLLKGKAKPFASTVQQTTNNMSFSTDSLDIGCVPRDFDGKLKEYGDTANSEFTAEKAATFLTTVPGATLITGV